MPAVYDELGLTPYNSIAYICGNPDMILAVDETLAARGFPEEQIKKELYWPKGKEAPECRPASTASKRGREACGYAGLATNARAAARSAAEEKRPSSSAYTKSGSFTLLRISSATPRVQGDASSSASRATVRGTARRRRLPRGSTSRRSRRRTRPAG